MTWSRRLQERAEKRLLARRQSSPPFPIPDYIMERALEVLRAPHNMILAAPEDSRINNVRVFSVSRGVDPDKV